MKNTPKPLNRLKPALLWLFLLCPFLCSAQLAATLMNPGRTVLSLQQLGQVQVMNPGPAMQANIRMVLVTQGGERLLTADYYGISINAGAQVLHLGQMQPTTREYGTNKEAKLLSTSGRLAFGKYSLCIFISETSLPQQPLENCANFEISPLTPPVLVYPADRSEITTPNPLLSWLPPGPAIEGITYVLKLTKIDSGQTALDALQRNPIIYLEENIPVNSQVYPPTATPLEEGERYAWQVAAYYGEAPLGITEVWEFRITKKLPEQEQDSLNRVYSRLKSKADGSYTIAVGQVDFVYEDRYRSGELQFRVTDLKGKDLTPKKVVLLKRPGDNRYTLPLDKDHSLRSGELYVLEVMNEKNEMLQLMFKYYRSEKDFNKSLRKEEE